MGLAVGVWLAARLVRGGVTADDVYTIAMAAVPGGIVGARVLFVLENWYLFADRPLAALAINEGGISIWGAVLGGSLAGALLARYLKLPVAYIADRAAVGLSVGQAIGRIGDIINGEHHGKEAFGLPWSVVYTNPNTLGEPGIPVHPAVAYELLWDLAVAGIVYWMIRKRFANGLPYVAYLFLYSLGRLVLGFYRKDTIVLPFDDGGLGMAQTLGVLFMAITVPWFIWLWKRQQGTHAVGSA